MGTYSSQNHLQRKVSTTWSNAFSVLAVQVYNSLPTSLESAISSSYSRIKNNESICHGYLSMQVLCWYKIMAHRDVPDSLQRLSQSSYSVSWRDCITGCEYTQSNLCCSVCWSMIMRDSWSLPHLPVLHPQNRSLNVAGQRDVHQTFKTSTAFVRTCIYGWSKIQRTFALCIAL